MRLKSSGYFGKFVSVCHMTSRGAATSKHEVERAKCFFFSSVSPAVPAGDALLSVARFDFDSFARQKFAGASVMRAMRQSAVLLCS